jgi:hypothetical protein
LVILKTFFTLDFKSHIEKFINSRLILNNAIIKQNKAIDPRVKICNDIFVLLCWYYKFPFIKVSSV